MNEMKTAIEGIDSISKRKNLWNTRQDLWNDQLEKKKDKRIKKKNLRELWIPVRETICEFLESRKMTTGRKGQKA